jgi:hypothetical protein
MTDIVGLKTAASSIRLPWEHGYESVKQRLIEYDDGAICRLSPSVLVRSFLQAVDSTSNG